jgi:glycosyltransferase involved in cell wall biosynthesis
VTASQPEAGHHTKPIGVTFDDKPSQHDRGRLVWSPMACLADGNQFVTSSPLDQPGPLGRASRKRQQVVMLLDNHYGPDPRVALETELLAEAGISTRIVAWDRREESGASTGLVSPPEVVRVSVPAPSRGGWRSLVAMMRFGRRVWRGRTGFFEGASLLIVHDIYLLPVGWLIARRLRLPFIYDAHEEYGLMEATRYPQWFLRCVTTLESRFARSAVVVVVPGTSRTARWDGVIDRPPVVLPNFVRRNRGVATGSPTEWDLLCAGKINDVRRLDLLVEVARLRPDIRIAIAGSGPRADYVARAASELSNLTYLGWHTDADGLFARTRAVYYGLDPDHPYSAVACPNTMYEALRHGKPLIFFCGGEPAQLSEEFTIGIRSAPSAAALSAALDRISEISDWDFDAAWQAVWERAETQNFISAIEAAAQRTR